MAETVRSPGPGRAAQAARNDRLILESARAVFLADPGAPITAVARHAGVGISALYSRYRSKDELLRKLSRDGLETFLREIEAALADERDRWTVFADFMGRLVDADIASLTLALAGKFTPTEDMWELATELGTRLAQDLFPKIKGALRPGVGPYDIAQVLELVAAVKTSDRARTQELRHRYLAVILDGLRAENAEPLPGPPPSWREIGERWEGGGYGRRDASLRGRRRDPELAAAGARLPRRRGTPGRA
jgi:AcrR family transcriptional regulator